MQITDLAINHGGQVSLRKFTITYLDLQATSGAGAKALTLVETSSPGPSGSPVVFAFPKESIVLGVQVHHTVAFSGGSLSAMTVSLGKSGSATLFTAAQDIFQAVADTTVQETALFKLGQITALTPAATFTPTGDSCSSATAGSVDIKVAFLNVTTP